jgi:hypothetical protein
VNDSRKQWNFASISDELVEERLSFKDADPKGL